MITVPKSKPKGNTIMKKIISSVLVAASLLAMLAAGVSAASFKNDKAVVFNSDGLTEKANGQYNTTGAEKSVLELYTGGSVQAFIRGNDRTDPGRFQTVAAAPNDPDSLVSVFRIDDHDDLAFIPHIERIEAQKAAEIAHFGRDGDRLFFNHKSLF
jgi:hypothetical protein